jgi:hypothetical protein
MIGLFYAQNIGRKPIIFIQNHQIDRHKAAVGECLLMAHNSQSSLLAN